MEAPPILGPLTDELVWRKKRSFWIWNIAVSGILMVVMPSIGVLATIGGMKGAFGKLGHSGADVGALSEHIEEVLVATAIGLGFSGIAFIWMMVAIIRLCILPKPGAFIPGMTR